MEDTFKVTNCHTSSFIVGGLQALQKNNRLHLILACLTNSTLSSLHYTDAQFYFPYCSCSTGYCQPNYMAYYYRCHCPCGKYSIQYHPWQDWILTSRVLSKSQCHGPLSSSKDVRFCSYRPNWGTIILEEFNALPTNGTWNFFPLATRKQCCY